MYESQRVLVRLPTLARRSVVIVLLLSIPVLLLTRAAFLNWQKQHEARLDNATLQSEAPAYTVRTVRQPLYRGSVVDRNGAPLAVSIPLASLWADPQHLRQATHAQRLDLAQALELNEDVLSGMLHKYRDKRFMYLRRHMVPQKAQTILDRVIPGVAVRTEYQRFYPTGEVGATLIGTTDIDDRGQEGLELSYDKWLSGKPALEHVLQDRRGGIIRNLDSVQTGRDGGDLHLALDGAIQYETYRALQETVLNHDAKAGTAVVLDIETGSFLAIANYPAPNPHQLDKENVAQLRNRAAMDLIEPGSIIKPFIVAGALENGAYTFEDTIDTAPGCAHVAGKAICDPHNYGTLSLREILMYSSQVGMVRLALGVEPDTILGVLRRIGVGAPMNMQLPVDPRGRMPGSLVPNSLAHVSVAYGYGLSGTVLQWARAYSVLANEGRMCLPTLILRSTRYKVPCKQVLNPQVARQVLAMLANVVSDEGTGARAQVFGYKVAGKTATIQKYDTKQQRYTGEEHIAAFAGIAPYTNPRIVVVVSVDEPRFYYHGGTVAAPLFSKIAAFSLRRLNVTPDNLRAAETPAIVAKRTAP